MSDFLRRLHEAAGYPAGYEYPIESCDHDHCALSVAVEEINRLREAIEDALTTLEGTTGQAVDAARTILRSARDDGEEVPDV